MATSQPALGIKPRVRNRRCGPNRGPKGTGRGKAALVFCALRLFLNPLIGFTTSCCFVNSVQDATRDAAERWR